VLIAHETGLPEDLIAQGLDTLSKEYRIRMDTVSEVIWVVRKLSYQARSPKILIATAKQLGTLHNSPLIQEFLEFYETLSIPYPYRMQRVSIRERERDKDKYSFRPAGGSPLLTVAGGDQETPETPPADPPSDHAPAHLSPNLMRALRSMEVEGFHCLANATKTNEHFWNAQLNVIEAQGLSVYACLLGVDAFYAGAPDRWPTTAREARARMRKSLGVAVERLKEQEQRQTPRERRERDVRRAAG
jgi:hypothetical protein